MLMYKSGFIHYEWFKTLCDGSENGIRFNNEPLKGSYDHD